MNKIIAWCKSFFSSKDVIKNSTVQVDGEAKDEKRGGGGGNNTSQIAATVFSTVIEGVKIAMATLLSIFVPQYCAESSGTCTLAENFSNLTTFNEFVIGWNFITLGLFVYLSYLQNKREAYFISHLEEDLNEPYTSLYKIAKDYPRIANKVKAFNKKLYAWNKVTIVFFGCNVLFSSILVFYFFYDGFRTATTLLANVLLVSTKLYHNVEICKKCNGSKVMALSTIHNTSVSYNVVDDNYVKPKQNTGIYTLSVKIDKQKLKSRQRRASA